MFENLQGIENIRSIRWTQLRPGMLVIGGIEINDIVPYEFRGYPVLTPSLLNELDEKFKFLAGRSILVADTQSGKAIELSKKLQIFDQQARTLEDFRQDHFKECKNFADTLGINSGIGILNTKIIDASYLVKNRLNSFSVPYGQGIDELELPSFFREAELKIKVGDLLTGRLSGALALPADGPVTLHLVVDFSFSMKQHLKLEIAASAANYLTDKLPKMLSNIKVILYAFSDTCRRTDPPFTGREVSKKDTHYASFMRQVLKHRESGRHNKVILMTDGMPSDYPEAMRMGCLMKEAEIDYTQILFSMSERFEEIIGQTPGIIVKDSIVDPDTISGNANIRQYSDSEVKEAHERIGQTFTSIADACNGNQVIMRFDTALRVVVVESFDRYMGLLSLAEGSFLSEKKDRPVSEGKIRLWKWQEG